MTAERPVEVELKYAVLDRAVGERLLNANALAGFRATGGPRPTQYEDRYVDTVSGTLGRAGFAVRLRTSQSGTVVSIKSTLTAAGALQRRDELEGPADRTSGPSSWAPSAARSHILEVAGDSPLVDLVTIRQLRRRRDLVTSDGTAAVELSLDEVDVMAQGRVVDRFVELELELTRGTESDLAPLRGLLDGHHGLGPALGSKLDRALQAASGAIAASVHGAAPVGAAAVTGDLPADAAGADVAAAPAAAAGNTNRQTETPVRPAATAGPAAQPELGHVARNGTLTNVVAASGEALEVLGRQSAPVPALARPPVGGPAQRRDEPATSRLDEPTAPRTSEELTPRVAREPTGITASSTTVNGVRSIADRRHESVAGNGSAREDVEPAPTVVEATPSARVRPFAALPGPDTHPRHSPAARAGVASTLMPSRAEESNSPTRPATAGRARIVTRIQPAEMGAATGSRVDAATALEEVLAAPVLAEAEPPASLVVETPPNGTRPAENLVPVAEGPTEPPDDPGLADATTMATVSAANGKAVGVTADDLHAEAGRKVLQFHFARMLDREAGTREGSDPEDLHSMRVATRRMRAAWRVFGDAYQPDRTRRYRRRLRVIAGRLGAVRDLDVLIEAAEAFAAGLPPDERDGLDPLLAAWHEQRDAARGRMLRELDSPGYRRFVEDYRAFVMTPGADAAPVGPTSPHRVRDTAASRIWSAYEGVRAFESVLRWADVPTLHQLRIAAKRLRYTLEFVREALGPEAPELIERVVALQDHLGAMNDAEVTAHLAREFLVERGAELSDRQAGAVSRYLVLRERDVTRLRRAVRGPWRGVAGMEFRSTLGRTVAVL